MASLTAKTVHGRTYYYARECQRVNGKPKIVRTTYLGSADDLIAAVRQHQQGQVPQPQAVEIAAFADVVVKQRDATSASKPRDVEAVSRFLLDVHSRMPTFLRLPFRVLTLIFDGSPYPSHGRPFHRLELAQRTAQIDTWRCSSVEARRRFVEFFGTLAVFGLYSELYGSDYEHAVRVDGV